MLSALLGLFSSDGFMPHGMCLLWNPGLLELHIWSDALIGLSYFSMPVCLLPWPILMSLSDLSRWAAGPNCDPDRL